VYTIIGIKYIVQVAMLVELAIIFVSRLEDIVRRQAAEAETAESGTSQRQKTKTEDED
jgi:hypothetical protein